MSDGAQRNDESRAAVERVCDLLRSVREQGPVVHNITNHVVMNTTANALLALGASPAMVHATDEVEEFVTLAGALVINIGTLSSAWLAAMKLATHRATRYAIPWVLDPVAVGATAYRTRAALELVACGPAVVRGNASEIGILAGDSNAQSRGPDSLQGSDSALQAALTLAAEHGTVVSLTGMTDYVTDGTRVASISNGDPLMARVTGLGCTASALSAAFAAVTDQTFDAAVAALVVLGIAGELAAREAAGPGSLQMHLLDHLHRIDESVIKQFTRLRIERH